VILAGATVISTWQMIVANRERAIATAVSDFLDKDLLQRADVYGSDPFTTPHRDLKLLEVVNRASTNLTGKFDKQPVVEATIRLTLGKIFIGLGEWPAAQEHLDRALKLFEKSLGSQDERVIETKFTLGRLLAARFELDAAKALFEEVLDYRIARLGSLHPKTLEVRVELAKGEYFKGRYAEAEEAFDEIRSEAAKAYGEDHELVQEAKSILGEIYWVTGRRANAAKLMEAVFRTRERTLGPYHLKTLQTLGGIAWASGEGPDGKHITLGTQNELESLLIERVENSFSNSLFNAWIMSRYRCSPLDSKGLMREVSELRQRAYELGLAKAGPDHHDTALYRIYQGFHAGGRGDLGEATKIFEEVAEQFARLTPNSMNVRVALYNLAQQYRMAGRWEDALATAERWKAASDATVQPEHSAYLWPIRGVSLIHIRLGDWEKAVALYSEVLKSSWKETYDYRNVAVLHGLNGQREEALRVIREGMGDHRQLIGTNAPAGEVVTAALVLDGLPDAHRHALLHSAPDLASSPQEELILGLAAFRRGDLELATRWLRPLAATCPDSYIRLVAGYYSAIVFQRQDRQTEARSSLSAANHLLKERLKSGITTEDFPDATHLGLCLLARDEAEIAIHERVMSEPVDAGYLSRERAKWEPVGQRLRQASEHARRQRWAEARRSFLDAMNHLQFSWEAAEVANLNPLASVRDMAARVFILSGDLEAYRSLCEPAADPEALAAFNLVPVSLNFADTARSEAVVFDTRRMPHYIEKSDQPAWREALRGFNDYARGDYADALPKFAAAHANVRYAHVCTALAMSAAAQARLGAHDEARRLLDQAEAKWSVLDENHPGDWYNFWPELALCQIALGEARRQVGGGTVAGK
jgi:tetratricopeptide (TPR) repeat protein